MDPFQDFSGHRTSDRDCAVSIHGRQHVGSLAAWIGGLAGRWKMGSSFGLSFIL
jgi:hypothetical protein